ncbi:MAG: acyltransferase [Alphaproteobacteria bacterium]
MNNTTFGGSTTHRQHLIALDTLRGIAALFIVVGHFGLTTPVLVPYVANARLMVDLFFVLSGFAIFYAYNDRLGTTRQLARFVWLRFWRLYPMHFVTLLYFIAIELAKPLAGLFMSVHHASFSLGGWKAIIVNLTLLQSFNIVPLTFNGPSWSISSEFYAYLLFAVIALFLRTRTTVLIMSAALSLIATAVLTIYGPAMDWTFNNGWVRGVAGFFAGVITCGIYLHLRDRVKPGCDVGWVAWLFLLAAIGFAASGGVGPIWIIPLSAALILSTALSGPEGAIWILVSKPMRWLGTISYSIYMVHAAIAFALGHLIESALTRAASIPMQLGLAALYLAAVIGVASLTFVWIEAPVRAWSRR